MTDKTNEKDDFVVGLRNKFNTPQKDGESLKAKKTSVEKIITAHNDIYKEAPERLKMVNDVGTARPKPFKEGENPLQESGNKGKENLPGKKYAEPGELRD